MGLFKRKKKTQTRGLVFAPGSLFDQICEGGYTPLSEIPEVVACARMIASLIGSTTIYLMANTESGDKRIKNELSRLIDITPTPTMTRMTWMEGIVMTLLLYGKGNAVVVPHTKRGLLERLEPMPADRVSFLPVGDDDYSILIDGIPHDPGDLLHFVYNPDRHNLWMGQGVTAAAKDILDNLMKGRTTEGSMMASEYHPAVVIKVDSTVPGMGTAEGRELLMEDYIKPKESGEPWIIPAELMDVQSIKPLSLSDLAISDTMTLNKKTIAALFGVPAFVVGAGEYDRHEWNTFIQTRVMTMCKGIAAELTKKLILSPKWYLKFNVRSLLDYDIKTVSDVLLGGSDRGFVTGDEWRDALNLGPAGLDEFRVLENYIPWDLSGMQKKLIQEDE